jgi:hypothetical protein
VVDTGYCPHPEQHGKAVGRLYSARGLVFEEQFMIAGNDNHTVTDLNPQPAWAKAWQLWTVFFPRRSITGRLVYGNVWRRYDGQHWKYKRCSPNLGSIKIVDPHPTKVPDRAQSCLIWP